LVSDRRSDAKTEAAVQRKRIDAIVFQEIGKFNGRFELQSASGYVLGARSDLYYDVKNMETGEQFTVRAVCRLDPQSLAADIGWQLELPI
jgi:hypothetical protein